MFEKNSHCSYCGAPFPPEDDWPRTCGRCGNISFLNPLPVAVVLVPADGGLVVIRRGVEPHRGKLALPGGYINLGESWEEAGAREVLEETGIALDAADIREFGVGNGSDGVIVVIGLASPPSPVHIPPFKPCEESTERLIIREPAELAYPLHTKIVRSYFRRDRRPVHKGEMW